MSIPRIGNSAIFRFCLGLALMGGAGLPSSAAESLSPPPEAGQGCEADLREGRPAVQAFIETFGSNARPSVFETRDFIVDGSKVVVLGYEEVTAIPTGKAWKAHWTMTFTVRRGKIVHVDEAVDTEAISAAFES